MHQDGAGLWHANVVVFGAWTPALGYVIDWLASAPPPFSPVHRTIDDGTAWFRLVDLVAPINASRREPLALHVASITGTIMWGGLHAMLLSRADAIVFVADTARTFIDRAEDARTEIDEWLRERGDAVVAYLFDHAGYTSLEYPDEHGNPVVESPAVLLEPTVMAERLRIAPHPWFATDARMRDGLAIPMRHVIDTLLALRDRLPALRSFAPHTPP